MEQSDLILVTKADGELEGRAKMTQNDYISALHYMQPRSEVWTPAVSWALFHKRTGICQPDYSVVKWKKIACFPIFFHHSY